MARHWHAAALLREYRGNCHNIALAAAGIGGTESHVLQALSSGIPPGQFDRLSHLPRIRLAAALESLRVRGLVDAAGEFTAAGQEIQNGSNR